MVEESDACSVNVGPQRRRHEIGRSSASLYDENERTPWDGQVAKTERHGASPSLRSIMSRASQCALSPGTFHANSMPSPMQASFASVMSRWTGGGGVSSGNG